MMTSLTACPMTKQGKLVGSWCALSAVSYLGSLPTTHVEASVFARQIQNGNPEADT